MLPTLRVKPVLEGLGGYAHLLWDVLKDIKRHGIDLRETSRHIVSIGISSLPIILLTAVFTGMVLALQTAYGLQRFGAKNYVGNLVGLALSRELGPVLTAIMVCGRVGAGIAAELASMVVTEQVDAIRALGGDPVRRLVTPRILAGVISMPLLSGLALLIGVWGGLVVAVGELGITAHQYYRSYLYAVQIRDVVDGLLKSLAFGLIVVSIACYKGLTCRGGTEGVGRTTTAAVVTGSLAIFISNYFITKLLIILNFK
ncbi:MAG: MlaE family ABC transporter permease [Pseudomonadota bacterium]|jgi:phospholipid/cholesterol/gamma-HCH transport system permease protein